MNMQLRARPRVVSQPPTSLTARGRTGLGVGQRLDGDTRRAMEQGFGRDLGHVRVHTDGRADHAARALGADAFALGSDIAVSARHRDLTGAAGRALLSHEIAHVVQQDAAGGARPGPAHEQAADGAARAIASGGRAAAQPAASTGVQRRIEFRELGRGQFSGMGRVGELIDRLNTISTALIFSVGEGGVLEYVENPYGDETEFDRRIKQLIDAADVLPMRMTNRHGMMTEQLDTPGPFNTPVTVDSYRTGYVDIDDLLAADDLALQAELLHFLSERHATRDYARRMGTAIPDAELDRAHAVGLQAELALLRDFFGDPGVRAIDFEQRIFRSSRNDTIRLNTRNLGGDQAGTFQARWEVVIRGSGRRMTAVEYRDLLAADRATAAAAPTEATPAAAP